MANTFFTTTAHAPNASEYASPRKTNELGWLLEDRAFSYVDVTDVVHSGGACGCPVERTVCLTLPFDLCSEQYKNITVPLVDSLTGEPFLVTKGTILEGAIVARGAHCKLRPDTTFVLGTIAENCECDEPTRFVTQADPIKGCVLNDVHFVKLDITKYKVSTPLFDVCDTWGATTTRSAYRSYNRGKGNEYACPYDMKQPPPCASANNDGDSSTSGGWGCDDDDTQSSATCCDEDPCANYDPLAVQPAAPGANMIIGEADDALLSITLCCGELKKSDLYVSLKLIQARSGGACDFADHGYSKVGCGC